MFSCFWPPETQEPAAVSPEETIRDLRSHIERQEKRERYLELKIATMAQEAKKKLVSGDKKGAVSLMKKKKLYEGELSKIDNIKMNLETQCIHLESATGTAQAFSAMSAGTKTMKKIHQTVGIDQVDEVMMDIKDEMQMAEEINNAIGQSIDPAMGMLDDDDLMKELQQLDCDDLEQQMNKAETGKLNFPQAPSTKHGISKKEEEDIRRLEAELAM